MIYLDNHSTTQIDPRVLKVMMPYLKDQYANASSAHQFGQSMNDAVEKARGQVAALIGAKSDQIFFTNSATEANNVVLNLCERDYGILTTNTEHSSVLNTLAALKNRDIIKHKPIKVKSDGTIDLKKLKKTVVCGDLVSIIAANNEIGTIHDIQVIDGMFKKDYPPLFHTDATQAIGKIQIDVSAMNLFALTMSSHKIYGPKGVGALYVRDPDKLEPLTHGGYQNTFISGTVNHPAIIGFGKACELMMDVKKENENIKEMRDRMMERLLTIKGSYVNGTMEHRLVGNLSITVPGLDSRLLVENLEGVCISGGSACMSDKPKPSATIKAIGVKHPGSVIRIGVGRFNTMDEIEEAADRIIYLAKELRK